MTHDKVLERNEKMNIERLNTISVQYKEVFLSFPFDPLDFSSRPPTSIYSEGVEQCGSIYSL